MTSRMVTHMLIFLTKRMQANAQIAYKSRGGGKALQLHIPDNDLISLLLFQVEEVSRL